MNGQIGRDAVRSTTVSNTKPGNVAWDLDPVIGDRREIAILQVTVWNSLPHIHSALHAATGPQIIDSTAVVMLVVFSFKPLPVQL